MEGPGLQGENTPMGKTQRLSCTRDAIVLFKEEMLYVGAMVTFFYCCDKTLLAKATYKRKHFIWSLWFQRAGVRGGGTKV